MTTVVPADPTRLRATTDGWELLGSSCARCGTVVFGVHAACLACAAAPVATVRVPGHGRVLSYTAVHRSAADWWGQVPYVLAEVEADGGVVVVASTVEGTVAVGDAVELRVTVVPRADAPGVAVYQWTVAR